MIRQARSLFAPKVLKFLGTLRLPAPLPFSAVEFFPRESMRYTSRIDAGVLMRQAARSWRNRIRTVFWRCCWRWPRGCVVGD